MNDPSHPIDLAERLIAWAREVGFPLAGIAPVTPGLGGDRLADWLAKGKHGEMGYMARHHQARLDPSAVLEGVRSILLVGLPYSAEERKTPGPGKGSISSYAWGRDYHEVIREKLERVEQSLRTEFPEVRTRKVVDSAPVMERDYARLAGLGWFGKNTLLLSRDFGSLFFLGGLLVDHWCRPSEPMKTDHCGTCTRCLDACPTKAFDGPYQLDPRRCISYLTIEHRSSIPWEHREGIGTWVYGCDVCQDVCPWNERRTRRGVEGSAEFRPRAGMNPISLVECLRMTHADFEARFRGTAIFRLGRDRWVRNALISAGNDRSAELESEILSLCEDSSAIVREAAYWALQRREGRLVGGDTGDGHGSH